MGKIEEREREEMAKKWCRNGEEIGEGQERDERQ